MANATYRIMSTDHFGRARVDEVAWPPPSPLLYFWLGADAYPEFRTISGLVPAKGPYTFVYDGGVAYGR